MHLTTIAAHGRILDVGTGPGKLPVYTAMAGPNLSVVGLDMDAILLHDAVKLACTRHVNERASFVRGDVRTLPFASEAFDMVVSTFSLHQWPYRQRGINETYRVLKPGGTALVFVGRRLLCPSLASVRDYFTGQAAKSMKAAWQAAGYHNVETKYTRFDRQFLRITAIK